MRLDTRSARTFHLLACAIAAIVGGTPLIASAQLPAQTDVAPAPDSLPLVLVSATPFSAVESVLLPVEQPRPQAQADGADYLKNLAGFSAVRKGGIDADPVLRGQSGSRLGILLDGAPVFGGCSNRMDPPTAYVFPDTFDRVRIIKGPQSVAYGPGLSAGAVLFERADDVFTDFGAPAASGRAKLLSGSFGRNEQLLQAKATSERVQLGLQANRAEMNNYRSGSGESIASRYRKQAWQLSSAVLFGDDSALQLQAGQSEGEAAYADRSMDGSQFDRDYWQLQLSQKNLSPYWASSELTLSQSRVDHVMDNYSLRHSGWLSTASAMNPKRANDKLRWHNTFNAAEHEFSLGLDAEQDRHQSRMSMNQRAEPYQRLPWNDSALFERQGIYGEWRYALAEHSAIVSGLRWDKTRTRDQRTSLGGHHMSVANPSRGRDRHDTLQAGFVRFEQHYASARGQGLWFIGYGQSQRLPDYWELFTKEAEYSRSAFELPLETHRQLDLGWQWQSERAELSASLFAAQTHNLVLIDSRYPKTMVMMGMRHPRTATVSRPISAESFGGELSAAYNLHGNWWTQAALAYVHASNLSDHQPLPQQPPLNAQLSLEYRQANWQAGVLWRASAAQHRVASGQGTIAGVDIAETAGFATAGLYANWQPSEQLTISAGVDNLFDRAYYEHLSRPVEPSAVIVERRIPEPGRSAYISVDYRF